MLRRWPINVARLSIKEWRCVLRDTSLMAVIIFAFSVAVYTTAVGMKAEVANASIGFIDEDHSLLSARLKDAIRPPYFKAPVDVPADRTVELMDKGDLIFVLIVPPHFEADVLSGRNPKIQLLVDATAMTQAGLGTQYLNQILVRELMELSQHQSVDNILPEQTVVRTLYNPNNESKWFSSVMQIITNVTVLGIILVGAAVIREREHGTIEHLLVMPVRPSEIAMAKILANGGIVVLAVMLSLALVVRGWLHVPLAGSAGLVLGGTALYLFAVSALGVMLATLASSMPQFGLLSAPVYAVLYLLSGAATPIESMPDAVQRLVHLSPTTQFVGFAQSVLYRDAGLEVVWPQLTTIAAAGGLFLWVAMLRFRGMLAAQG